MADTTTNSREISWDEIRDADGRDGKSWAVVNGRVIDLGAFRKRHPGGDVIRICLGREATDLVEMYHPLQSRARVESTIKALPQIGVASECTTNYKGETYGKGPHMDKAKSSGATLGV